MFLIFINYLIANSSSLNYSFMNKGFLLISILLIFTQCAKEREISTERAFYYWQTSLNFDSTANDLANKMKLETLYLRYFDIDYSPGYKSGVPVGILNLDKGDNAFFKGRKVIPTVFITNRTFKQLENKEIEELAKNTVKKIEEITGDLERQYSNSILDYDDFSSWDEYEKEGKKAAAIFINNIQEVQIDCDWTASTKDKFFYFLELLKPKLNGRTLSCTVRLHQYKDRKLMGIPPVDRGLLMCYNVADARNYKTPNAILQSKIVKQYLKGDTYPIKLDIGLPMFSWAAWFNGKEFKGILSNWNELDAKNKTLYAKKEGNYYQVKTDTLIGNNYLREGDILRWDNSSEEEMKETINLLYDKLDLETIRITFFDWENKKIKRHEKILEQYYREFE